MKDMQKNIFSLYFWQIIDSYLIFLNIKILHLVHKKLKVPNQWMGFEL